MYISLFYINDLLTNYCNNNAQKSVMILGDAISIKTVFTTSRNYYLICNLYQ